MKNIVEVKGLNSIISTSRNNVFVLNDITFSIPKGKIIGIIGESGSGKTQLMFAITASQYHSPGVTSGEVTYYLPSPVNIYPDSVDFTNHYSIYKTFDGKYKKRNSQRFNKIVNSGVKAMRGEVFSIIPQDCGSYLNPYWNIETLFKKVFDRLMISRKNGDLGFNEFLIRNIKKFDLDPDSVRYKYPHELSGGEQQRVINAFVMSHNPKILFADESTTGLDVSRQKKVIAEFNKMISNQRGDTAIVLISHDIAFLDHLVDIYFVMYGGHLVESIYNKKRLLDRESLHPYTKDLIAALSLSNDSKDKKNNRIISEPIDHKKKPEGCPYRMNCYLYKNGDTGLRDKCSTAFPPLISYATKEEAESVDSDWLRCWGHGPGDLG